MSSNILLEVSIQLTDVLQRANTSIENLFVITCYYEDKKHILDSYLKHKTDIQKIVFMQELLRKQLLFTEEPYEELLENFSLNKYQLTSVAKDVCAISEGKSILPEKLNDNLLIKSVENLVLSGEEKEKIKFEAFLNEFLSKFPEGKKNNGGKIIRTNIDDVRSKMVKFLNKYKRYNNFKLIIDATQSFISNYRGDFSYCPTAEYFISKNGTSALATECESVLSGKNKGTISNPFENLM